jgi:asparagine synthetase B (glutamine-hydrolysing)
MFLIAVTRNQIQERFHSAEWNVRQTKIDSLLATIVTDSFLSQCSTDATGFSIIESPLIGGPYARAIILSEIIFDGKENKLSVFKPTESGRPIYYHINSRAEFYCSTHISMLRKAGVILEEDTRVLPEFFVYRYVVPPKTLYKNINQLCTGSRLYIALINGQCIAQSERKYNPFSVKSAISPEFTSIEKNIKQTRANLSHSINLLSPCSSGVCVLLRGGLDSSILFAICRDALGISKSYSTSYPFESPSNDVEKEYATSAGEALKSDHYFYEADNKEYLYGFLESISTAEEPLHHLQSVMFNLLFKKGLPHDRDIVISGQGGGQMGFSAWVCTMMYMLGTITRYTGCYLNNHGFLS